MPLIGRGAAALALVLGQAGQNCIVGRPTLEPEQQDLVAEVERGDISPRAIYLRENNGHLD